MKGFLDLCMGRNKQYADKFWWLEQKFISLEQSRCNIEEDYDSLWVSYSILITENNSVIEENLYYRDQGLKTKAEIFISKNISKKPDYWTFFKMGGSDVEMSVIM